MAKVVGVTSPLHMGEAHFTPIRGGPQRLEEHTMSNVFVLNTNCQPLDPVHPGRARLLLKQGQAAVFRYHPFTIILKAAVPTARTPPLRLKIDPGSKTTGLALVDDAMGAVVFAAELHHRGALIKQRLLARRAVRRSRRHRKTRHRPRRFLNRRRRTDWLPPSLASRVANIITWVNRLRRLAPVGSLSLELVRFDTQKLQNAEITDVEYQQGELVGYEVREYLLEKWSRRCAYCGVSGVSLQIEHIVPRSRGGSNRISNLALACRSCNQQKANRTAAEFGHPQVQAQARQSLRDAAAVNSTRWALYQQLLLLGLSIETGTGGLTKYNRVLRGWRKAHWLDAACVGQSTPQGLQIKNVTVLSIKATGHGNRQMCRTDRYGFPRLHKARCNRYFGFRTGDLARAIVPAGKHKGTHVGRVTVRATGRFRVGLVDGIAHQRLRRLWRSDGYDYQILKGDVALPHV